MTESKHHPLRVSSHIWKAGVKQGEAHRLATKHPYPKHTDNHAPKDEPSTRRNHNHHAPNRHRQRLQSPLPRHLRRDELDRRGRDAELAQRFQRRRTQRPWKLAWSLGMSLALACAVRRKVAIVDTWCLACRRHLPPVSRFQLLRAIQGDEGKKGKTGMCQNRRRWRCGRKE